MKKKIEKLKMFLCQRAERALIFVYTIKSKIPNKFACFGDDETNNTKH